MPDMEKYITKALDTLEEICDAKPPESDGEYNSRDHRLRASEAILQHARERSIVINFNGAVPVDPSII